MKNLGCLGSPFNRRFTARQTREERVVSSRFADNFAVFIYFGIIVTQLFFHPSFVFVEIIFIGKDIL